LGGHLVIRQLRQESITSVLKFTARRVDLTTKYIPITLVPLCFSCRITPKTSYELVKMLLISVFIMITVADNLPITQRYSFQFVHSYM